MPLYLLLLLTTQAYIPLILLFNISHVHSHVSRIKHNPFENASCGPKALFLICKQEGINTTVENLYTVAHTTTRGTTLTGLAEAAKSVGFKATGVKMDVQAIKNLNSPALAWVDNNHYIAVFSVNGNVAHVHDPNKLRMEIMPITILIRRSHGIFLLLSR